MVPPIVSLKLLGLVKMQEKSNIDFEILPIPKNLSPIDIALLNTSRQTILTKLCLEEKTLSRLAEDVKLQPSSVFESLELLEKRGFVKKDQNKVYSLTTKGKSISFFFLKPNGVSEEQIQHLFDVFLKEEVEIEDEENRKEIIENRFTL